MKLFKILVFGIFVSFITSIVIHYKYLIIPYKIRNTPEYYFGFTELYNKEVIPLKEQVKRLESELKACEKEL
ncbi:hypothetical protein [Tenacibaculum maritimum]|uniref:hypothetical protein n=1 Tax=Tenacibaculum maritimum TaxID=107401 RepID=UPI00387651B7